MQLSATAFLSDGTSKVVTDTAVWDSTNGNIVSVSPAGLVTAGSQRGEGEIVAKYAGLPPARSGAGSSSRTQFVIPAGTYVLSGTVKDDGVPLGGVAIEVTAGLSAGMAATANPTFRLYGVAGDTEIRVSKAGYETQIRRVVVASHMSEDFDLVLASPRLTVAGTYALSVVAAVECRDRLPEAARARAYTAVVSQAGAQLTVMLEGAKLGSSHGPSNSFGGSVEPTRLLFSLSSYSGDSHEPWNFRPPSVMELLAAPSTFVIFSGSVVAAQNGNGYTGTLDGTVEVLELLGGPWDYGEAYVSVAYCRSTRHQFVLTR